MGYFDYIILGLPLWIWNVLMLCLLFGFGVYFIVFPDQFEKLKGTFYTIKNPEKVIKVIIHHDNSLFKVYWRLVPNDDIFIIKKEFYLYDKDSVSKEHDFYVAKHKLIPPSIWIVKDLFVKKVDGKQVFKLGGMKEYDFYKFFKIKQKGKKHAEIHYMFNVPTPINFNISSEGKPKIEFSSVNLKKFKENDLFEKLLKLKGEMQIMMVLIALLVANLGVSVFLLSKSMGWIE